MAADTHRPLSSTRSIGEVRRAAQYLQQNAYQVKLDMHASPIGTHVVLPDEPVTPSLGDDAPLARQRTPEEDEALDVVSDEVAEDPNSAVVTAMGMGGLGVSGPIVVDPHPEDDYAFIYGPEDSNVSHGGTESGETSASGAAAAAEPGDAAAPVQPHRHRPLPPSYAALGFRRAIYKDTSICLWNPNSVAAIAGVVLPLTRTRLENPFHYRFGHIEHVRPGVRQRITRRFRLHRQRRVVRPAAQEAVGAAAQNPAPPPAGAAEAPATPAFTASTPTPAPAAEPIDMSGVLIPVSPENPPSEAMLEPLPSVEDAAGPGGT